MLSAVLDADVLYPMVLRDTLLRIAAAGAYRLHWSGRILDEVERNLMRNHIMTGDKAATLRAIMEEAFPEAAIEGWEAIEGTMPNHPKDRHVAATAVAAGAHVIVTSNLRDFHPLPEGLMAMSPDTFLCELLETMPAFVAAALHAQAASFRRPPTTPLQLLGQLSRVTPRFCERARDLFNQ